MPLSDIEIAQAARMQRITQIAEKLGIPEDQLEPYGHYKAKISLDFVDSLAKKKDGKLDRKSTRLNSSHIQKSRMPSSA